MAHHSSTSSVPAEISEFLAKEVAPFLESQELPVDSTTAYASGSLIEGHGNSLSDVDVFLITTGSPPQNLVYDPEGRAQASENCVVAVGYVGDRRVDLEYWHPQRVDELADKVARLDLGDNFVITLSYSEQEFLHRLRVGVPLLRQDLFEQTRSRFDFSRVAMALTLGAVRALDNALDDVSGMLEDDDREAALFRVRDVLGFAVAAWNYHQGSTNPTPKWRMKVLRSLPEDERTKFLIEESLRLQFPSAADLLTNAKRCRDYLESCISLSNRVTEWIMP